ncbi:MAG: ABC transporter ATP-binding protein [Burkholderiales bacterium]|nr:ABC transporter ATP-binding protein [Burkholderiales bacterium]
MADALVVEELSKSFGALRAVDGVGFAVKDGDVHSLIGPNGAGKTTVFNCISGFLRPAEGRVLLRGEDVTAWPPHRLIPAGLARTFQITKVFGDLTVLENVALAARSRLGQNLRMWRRASKVTSANVEALEILEMLGLAENASANADHLAHGDKRILEIAIALALRPRLLMLDEPTAGMSAGETEHIGKLVRRIAARTSVLLVEHDMEMVLGISDQVTVMTQGRVIASGTPDAISRDTNVQDAYLGALDARNL